MTNVKMDWALLVRAGAKPLELARTRLLVRESKGLDDDAERFLSSIEEMTCWDVLAWMAQRGPTPRELPPGVPSNAALVERFLTVWSPENGFDIDRTTMTTIWNIHIASIESETWDELVEKMLPRLRAMPPEPRFGNFAALAQRTLHGCKVFEGLCRLPSTNVPPRLCVRAPIHTEVDAYDDLVEAIVACRRDHRRCVEVLAERVHRIVDTGDIYPLWLIAKESILRGIPDPRRVLPRRVTFSFEETRLSEEEHGAIPPAESCVWIALWWPGEGAHIARAWLRDQLLDAVGRGVPAKWVSECALGVTTRLERFEVPAIDPEVTPMLKAWLAQRTEFDALMLRSLERGTPLPHVWVTIVRDLSEHSASAWDDAFRWVEGKPVRVVERTDGTRWIQDSQYEMSLWPEVEALGVSSAFAAWKWVLFSAPIPDGADEAFFDRLGRCIEVFRDLADLMVLDETFTLSPFGDIAPECWMRLAAFPASEARRAELLRMVLVRPALLAMPGAELAISKLAPLRDDEVSRVLDSLDALGLDPQAESILHAMMKLAGERLRPGLTRTLTAAVESEDPFSDEWLRLAVVLAPGMEPEAQRALRAAMTSRSLRWLAKHGDVMADAFRWPFDLAEVARERVRQNPDEVFALPVEARFSSLFFERASWLAAHGNDVAPADDRDHRSTADRVDSTIMELLKRMDPLGLDPSALNDIARARAREGGDEHAIAFFERLMRSGCTSRDLCELVVARLKRALPGAGRSGSRSHSKRLAAWFGARLTTRSSWDAKNDPPGRRLIDALVDSHRNALMLAVWGAIQEGARHRTGAEVAEVADGDEPGGSAPPQTSLINAILMAFADVFGARARDAISRGDVPGALRALHAIMELDAPSRAYRFVGPLRKLAKGNEALETAVEACEHLLRSDADRAPTSDNIARALDAFAPGRD